MCSGLAICRRCLGDVLGWRPLTRNGIWNERPSSRARPSRPERMEFEEPVHRLEGPRSHREGHRRGQGRRAEAEGAGAGVRCRFHLGAVARAAYARSGAGRNGPDRPADHAQSRAQRARLRRSLRPQQRRRPRKVGRGAGAYLAPFLRRPAARRRKPEGHPGPHAAVLRSGNPALRAARRAHTGSGARQFAARADYGAGEAVAGRHPGPRTRDRRADHLPAQRGFHGGIEARSGGVFYCHSGARAAPADCAPE